LWGWRRRQFEFSDTSKFHWRRKFSKYKYVFLFNLNNNYY
jgi:hypothetical protein